LFEQGGHPLPGFGRALAIEIVGDGPQMLVGVVEIQALTSVRTTILGSKPYPQGSVRDDQHFLGLRPSAGEGLAIELAYERLPSQAGNRIAALADHGSTPCGRGSMIQTEDGAHIDPVPARDRLAFGAEFLGLPPVIALANVPGVDFDHQPEWWGRRPLGGTGQLLAVFPSIELGPGAGARSLRFEPLAMSFPLQRATREIEAQPFGHQDGLLGRHFADEQSRYFLHVRRSRGILTQA